MQAPDHVVEELTHSGWATDPAALTELFRHFREPLTRYACRITGDAATAADVLQDVFLRLWENRAKVTIEVSLQAFLFTMVRNRAYNVNRKQQRINREVVVEEVLNQRPDDSSIAEEVSAQNLKHLLYRWIEMLPPRRAEAFVLSRYHGLSHREIATIMELSQRTVDTHILLALRELRRRMDALQHPLTTMES